MSSPQAPAPRRGFSPLYLLPVAIIVALVGVLVWQRDAFLGGGSPQSAVTVSPGSGSSAPAGATVTDGAADAGNGTGASSGAGGDGSDDSAGEPSTTTVTVNTGGDAGAITVSSVQKWARDVNNGDTASLSAKCWTFPDSYIRERYLGHRDRLAAVMAQTPGGTQTGVSWGNTMTDADSAFVSWEEGDSDYACPRVHLAGLDDIPDDLVAYHVQRLILRERGTPVNPNDTEANYPTLVCTSPATPVNTDIRNLDRADPDGITVTGHTGTGSDETWTVDAGSVTFTVRNMLSEACIDSAS